MGLRLGLGLGLRSGLSPGRKSTRILIASVCMEMGSESLKSVRNLLSKLRSLLESEFLKHGP